MAFGQTEHACQTFPMCLPKRSQYATDAEWDRECMRRAKDAIAWQRTEAGISARQAWEKWEREHIERIREDVASGKVRKPEKTAVLKRLPELPPPPHEHVPAWSGARVAAYSLGSVVLVGVGVLVGWMLGRRGQP